MTRDPKIIRVTPGSELDRLLDQAAAAPLRLVRAHDSYQIVRDHAEDVATPLSEDEINAIWDETLGSWSDIDADALVRQVYRWREEGSRHAQGS